MSFKCAFSSIVLHRTRSPGFLSAYFSKPVLISCTHNIDVRFAGHSHWQNIKKTKESKDLAKCRAFNSFIRSIRKEVFRGSADPKMNSKLASLISQAQAINMPMTTINNVIKRFELLKKNPLRQSLAYKGSNGVMYLIEIASENLSRSRSELNFLFKKQGIGKTDAPLRTAFIGKGNVIAKPPENTPDPMERTVEDAIEVGAEEVEPAEELPDYFKFVCEESDLNIVKTKLESKNYTVDSAELYFIPKCPVELEEEELEKLYDFLQKIEEHPDVERVIINVV